MLPILSIASPNINISFILLSLLTTITCILGYNKNTKIASILLIKILNYAFAECPVTALNISYA
ncbi:hypothetical protein GCM10023142_15300 [Anaerocolumna aminovalerica]